MPCANLSIFDRKIICGDCGNYYGPRLWDSNSKGKVYVWLCVQKSRGKTDCDTPIVRIEDLQNAFVQAFNQIIYDKADLVAMMEKEITDVSQEHAALIKQHCADLAERPDFITGFDEDAFRYFVERIKVMPDGNLVVCFNDGREISVELPKKKSKSNRSTAR